MATSQTEMLYPHPTSNRRPQWFRSYTRFLRPVHAVTLGGLYDYYSPDENHI